MNDLDRLMELIRTDEFQDVGQMRIGSARWSSAGGLVLRALIEIGDYERSTWHLRFSAVIEQNLTVITHCGLNIWRDHPAVSQYTDPHHFLHFAAAPGSPAEVVGELLAAHASIVDDWIPFDRYLSREVPLAKLLSSGSGLIATGPDFLVNAYSEVLQRFNCQPVQTALPAGRQPQQAVIAHFGESYVVAENLTVRRLSNKTS